jgi:hypothetical protein
MATIKVLQGFPKIKDNYDIINENDQAINNQLVSHINGTTDKHDAVDVVFTPIPNVTSIEVQGAITQVNTRVSNIIASSGTSSTEVVDARLSPTYGTFATLKSRLDNADVRIEKTEKPVQQSVSLTELSQIQSVTDSYNSIAEIEVGGATLNQVVVNGDFSGGTTGYAPGSATLAVSSKVLSITGNGGLSVPYADKTLITLKVGEKAFFKMRVRVTNSDATDLFLQLRRGSNAFSTFVKTGLVQNGWVDVYGIATNNVSDGSIVGRIGHTYVNSATANGKVMEVDGNVGVFAIPLTGTPYESYTADQMNALVNTYWEGLRSTQSVELGSRGRNLFDGELELGELNANGEKISSTTRLVSKNFNVIPNNINARLVAKDFTFTSNQIYFYDKNHVYISRILNLSNATVITIPINSKYYKIVFVGTTDFNVKYQVNSGAVALPYEPYQGSTAKITYTDPTKFDGARLPNNTVNSTLYKDGKWASVKRVARYVLQSADVTQVFTGNVRIFAITRLDKRRSLIGNMLLHANFQSINTPLDANDISMIGKMYHSDNTGTIRFIFSNTTTLEQAQSALAGTVIYYELATPITINESQFAENGITVDGVLTSNNDYTEYFVDNYDLFAPTSVTYSTNIAKSVENLKESTQGIRELINSFDNDKWIAPTLINSFVNVGGAFPTVGYYKDPNGVVRLRGRIATGASGASPFTLPIGFRPSTTKTFPIVSNNVFGYVTIANTGVINVFGSATYYALDSISFKAVTV